MNKPFKTLALLISAVAAIPAIAIDPKTVQSGDVIGTIGGAKYVEEGDVVCAICGESIEIGDGIEITTEKKGFLSKHWNTIMGVLLGIVLCRLCSNISEIAAMNR